MSLNLSELKIGAGMALFTMFLMGPLGLAQDRDRDWDYQRGLYTRLDPGTVIPVRMNETINVYRSDNRVYYGTVDRDVWGQNGHLAIPRGSSAELMVRLEPDNDLILDLESVTVNGQRYAVRSNPNRYESRQDNSVVGAIVGAISGGEVRGQAVRIPRDSVVTFRLDEPLDMGVADRGEMRNGNHYHDWYRDRQ